MAPRLRKIVGGPIADTLRAIAIEHPDWGPMQVYREIDKRTADEDKAAMPSVRTVQRFLAEFNRPDESGPWTLVDADPDDALLVLPVIRGLLMKVYVVIRYEDDLNIFATREAARAFLAEEARLRWEAARDPLSREYGRAWAVRARQLSLSDFVLAWVEFGVDEVEVRTA